MPTTPTSSLPTESLGALFDELEKISSSDPQRDLRTKKLKKFLKNTALITAGAGAGTAVAMVADRALTNAVAPKLNGLSRETKLALLGMGLGVASTGAFLAGAYMKQATDDQ